MIAGKYSERKAAFTLIEMLVVIAIIGIMTALLMPALATARQHSYATACMSNMKQVGTALSLFLADNRNFTPPLSEDLSMNGETYTDSFGNTYNSVRKTCLFTYWHKSGDYPDPIRDGVGYLGPYLGITKIYKYGSHPEKVLGCPAIRTGVEETTTIYNGVVSKAYRMRGRSFSRNMGGMLVGEYTPDRVPLNVSRVRYPSQLCTFADGEAVEGVLYWLRYNTDDDPFNNTWCIPIARHFNRCSSLFMDGHVNAMTFGELYVAKHILWKQQ